MKKAALLSFLLVGLIALLVTACGDSLQPTAGAVATIDPTRDARRDKTPVIKVVVILKSLTNPFFLEMAKGARVAQQVTGIDLEIRTATPETSAEQQIRIVQEQIKSGVNAIVISPVDVRRLAPALKAAHDAGIKIVNVDERLDADALKAQQLAEVPYVGVNSEQAAYQAARYLASRVDRPTEAAIVEGVAGTNTANDRKRGAQRAFNENHHIRLVASQAANWKSDQAYELATSLFKAHPNIRLVYCSNDLMAIGVIKYLHDNGRTDVLVGGFDALRQAKDAVRAGLMAVTVDQHAFMQAYVGVTSALKLLRGQAVPSQEMVDAELVTATSLR